MYTKHAKCACIMEEFNKYDPNDFNSNGQFFRLICPAFIMQFTHTNFKEIFWEIMYT